MKIRLVVVPPGGGEADYSIFIDMPAIPAAGDYIGVIVPGDQGGRSFVVKRTWWTVTSAADDEGYIEAGKEKYGSTDEISVECYPASGPYDSASHKRVVAMYEARGKGKIELDESMY